jgi:hypothetical protein
MNGTACLVERAQRGIEGSGSVVKITGLKDAFCAHDPSVPDRSSGRIYLR